MLYPTTFAEVLAFQERSTECGGGAVPLPDSVSTIGAFVALLEKVKAAVVAGKTHIPASIT